MVDADAVDAVGLSDAPVLGCEFITVPLTTKSILSAPTRTSSAFDGLSGSVRLLHGVAGRLGGRLYGGRVAIAALDQPRSVLRHHEVQIACLLALRYCCRRTPGRSSWCGRSASSRVNCRRPRPQQKCDASSCMSASCPARPDTIMYRRTGMGMALARRMHGSPSCSLALVQLPPFQWFRLVDRAVFSHPCGGRASPAAALTLAILVALTWH